MGSKNKKSLFKTYKNARTNQSPSGICIEKLKDRLSHSLHDSYSYMYKIDYHTLFMIATATCRR